MPDRPKPVVMEVPGVVPPHPAPSPAPTSQEAPDGASEQSVAHSSGKVRIGAPARQWLREAAAAVGVDRSKANAMADWLEKQQAVRIFALERVPEPPLQVFGTPDVTPFVPRRPQQEEGSNPTEG